MSQTSKLPLSELHDIALKEARKIHRTISEHGAAIDECGNVKRFGGDGDAVDIEITSTTKITVHNHPHEFKIPSSFSGDDVYNLLHYNLDEILVCGYGCSYYLRKGTCIMRSFDVRRDLNKIYKEIDKVSKKKYISGNGKTDLKSIKEDYKKYKLTVELEYHKALREYSHTKGLSYGRTKL